MSAQKRLRMARKRRTQIASTLDALETGRITLETVLKRPPRCLSNVSVYQVMVHTPRLGPEGIKKCLMACKIWPEDRIRDLPLEKRELIISHLPPRARKYEPAK